MDLLFKKKSLLVREAFFKKYFYYLPCVVTVEAFMKK